MRISNSELTNVVNAYLKRIRTSRERFSAQTETTRRGDSISLSRTAQELTRLRAQLEKLPEVRPQLLDEVKQKLDRGDYEVPAEEIAEKMLARALADRLAGVAEKE
jgi:negative regulator of flagellin synthesis FlgM